MRMNHTTVYRRLGGAYFIVKGTSLISRLSKLLGCSASLLTPTYTASSVARFLSSLFVFVFVFLLVFVFVLVDARRRSFLEMVDVGLIHLSRTFARVHATVAATKSRTNQNGVRRDVRTRREHVQDGGEGVVGVACGRYVVREKHGGRGDDKGLDEGRMREIRVVGMANDDSRTDVQIRASQVGRQSQGAYLVPAGGLRPPSAPSFLHEVAEKTPTATRETEDDVDVFFLGVRGRTDSYLR